MTMPPDSEENGVATSLRDRLDRYFHNLDGEKPLLVHDMVMSAVERILLDYMMERTEGNLSQAAAILGINRNTLRKKLDQYKLR